MKNNVFSEMNILTKMMCVFYFLPFLVHVYSVRLIKKCNENRFSVAKDSIIQACFRKCNCMYKVPAWIFLMLLRIFQRKCYPDVNKYLHTIYLGISRSSQFFALASFSFTVFSSSCCIFCNVLIRLRKQMYSSCLKIATLLKMYLTGRNISVY